MSARALLDRHARLQARIDLERVVRARRRRRSAARAASAPTARSPSRGTRSPAAARRPLRAARRSARSCARRRRGRCRTGAATARGRARRRGAGRASPPPRRNVRPSAGCTRRMSKNGGDTPAADSRTGSPAPVRSAVIVVVGGHRPRTPCSSGPSRGSRPARRRCRARLRRCRFSHTFTSRSGSRYGSGRSSTASTAEKIAVLPPMPSASVSSATTVTPGCLTSSRTAYRASLNPCAHPPPPASELSSGGAPGLRRPTASRSPCRATQASATACIHSAQHRPAGAPGPRRAAVRTSAPCRRRTRRRDPRGKCQQHEQPVEDRHDPRLREQPLGPRLEHHRLEPSRFARPRPPTRAASAGNTGAARRPGRRSRRSPHSSIKPSASMARSVR